MSAYGYWKLDGRSLKSVSGIKIFALGGSKSIDQKVRQSLVDLVNGTQSRERLGKDLPQMSIEFRFHGRGIEKHAERALIQEVIEDNDNWTLESPTTGRIWRNFSRAAFSTLGDPQDDQEGTGRIALKVSAILNGIWVADGGDYEYCTSGYFTLQSDGTYVDQDGNNTGTTPTVELPAQATGFPQATQDDFSEGQPAVVSSRFETGPDGTEDVWFTTYDMTGFLIPAPASAGDVGVYTICSSPDRVSLSGGADSVLPLGIGEGAVDEYEVDGPVENDSVPEPTIGMGVGSAAIAEESIGDP